MLNKEEAQLLMQNLTLNIGSASGFVISTFLLLQSKRDPDPLYRRAIILLTVGILMWFVAEFSWSYHVYFLHVEVPFPGYPDIFYLAGYPLVISFLWISDRIIGNRMNATLQNRLVVVAVTISVTAYILNFFILNVAESILGVTPPTWDDTLLLLVSIAYPFLDVALIIPSIILIHRVRVWGTGAFFWVLISLGMVMLAAGDTGFGYTAMDDFGALSNEAIWDMIYGISYICIDGALLYQLIASRKGIKMHSIESEKLLQVDTNLD